MKIQIVSVFKVIRVVGRETWNVGQAVQDVQIRKDNTLSLLEAVVAVAVVV